MPINKKVQDEIKEKFEKSLTDMSKQELKELLMINTYKVAMMRAQLESLTEILIKQKLTTYEEIWKKTNENFKHSGI